MLDSRLSTLPFSYPHKVANEVDPLDYAHLSPRELRENNVALNIKTLVVHMQLKAIYDGFGLPSDLAEWTTLNTELILGPNIAETDHI